MILDSFRLTRCNYNFPFTRKRRGEEGGWAGDHSKYQSFLILSQPLVFIVCAAMRCSRGVRNLPRM